ncbi:MAG: hypothetical protein QNJ54_23705 [Prochloraceae cyanobacterium]|nr:hypothetical protein [Prochloraceae cyanobacterium]
MKLFKSVLAGLVLGTATLPTLISPAEAACSLKIGLYQHEDGTKLYLSRISGGGYRLNVPQHDYKVVGNCDGKTFTGIRGSTKFDDRPSVILKLQKRGSKYYYYEPGGPRGAWYRYRG